MSEQPSSLPEDERQDCPAVPDFDLIRPIGRGGFGQVWLARNHTTGHLRAVKVIPFHTPGATDPAGREIMSLSRLETNVGRHHPNLLTIHHVGKTADHLFYVMDLADDASLSAAHSGMAVLSCDEEDEAIFPWRRHRRSASSCHALIRRFRCHKTRPNHYSSSDPNCSASSSDPNCSAMPCYAISLQD